MNTSAAEVQGVGHVGSTGIGSHPGTTQDAFAEAARMVLDLVSIPYVPEVPGRGPGADMIGRSLALLDGLGADLQPAGWRITDNPGVDHRRAISLLGQDLDTVEELAQGYAGAFKVSYAGPWTLAASVERPRGDRVLADHGLRRELAESFASGLARHVAQLARRVPGARWIVQIDEPSLPAVIGGKVPTASGFSRHRSVDVPKAAPVLEMVMTAVHEAGAESWVHCCAAGIPFDLLSRVGGPGPAPGLAVPAETLDAAGLDAVGTAMEAGRRVVLGVVPALDVGPAPLSDTMILARVTRLLDVLGLEPDERLVLAPACGLAGASRAWARQALTLAAGAARAVDDER